MAKKTGLERRQLEREVRWMMRHVPTDPAALARLMADVIVTLIDKNNRAIAASFDDEPDEGDG
jgi:hypothetical protein